jgi:hypothetical protein
MSNLIATPPAATTARAFIQAVVHADLHALEGLLTEDVWFRSLLPRGAIEHRHRGPVLAALHSWFGTPQEVRVLSTYHHDADLREHVGWRVLVRPEWQPDVWHLIEQIGYVRVAEGRIRRVDLVCTGFQPQVGDPDPVRHDIRA